MTSISVVIIARNEAHIIERTLDAVKQLTDDVIVVDSGSTDGTQAIVKNKNAALIETTWEGFGINKNKGIAAAKYDWILSIDADEVPDEILLKALASAHLSNAATVFSIRFKTFLGNKLIRYGEWGNDSHIRLFNRTRVKWNSAKVHEQLVIDKDISVKNIEGYILHYTMKDMAEYSMKMTQYAMLNAEGYFKRGKKSSWFKQVVSPRFSFVQNYIFKLGFLDGIEGYWIARMTAHYTFLKYARLHELNEAKK